MYVFCEHATVPPFDLSDEISNKNYVLVPSIHPLNKRKNARYCARFEHWEGNVLEIYTGIASLYEN